MGLAHRGQGLARTGHNAVQRRGVVATLVTQGAVLGGMVATFWLVNVLNFITWYSLTSFGIQPRTLHGLVGILFAPFLHAGFFHLIANTVPFIMLGWLVMVRRVRDFFAVFFISTLISGLGVWLLGGSHTVHVGASGVIFGFLGYLLSRGLFERRILSIAISIVTFVVYGGLLWGVMPSQEAAVRHISWMMHLFGFIGGVTAAYTMTRTPQLPPPGRAHALE